MALEMPAADIAAFSSRLELPIGVVALAGDEVAGIAALKAESITGLPRLSPWAAAGLVHPTMRGRGIGTQLLVALENVAKELGYPRVYCATNTAESLLRRAGWQFRENVLHDGEDLSVYEKAL